VSFPVAKLPDGRAMVNLGSSARTAPGWTNIDSSLILKLSQHPRLSALLWRVGLINDERYRRIRDIRGACLVWNLAKGVPFPDRTFDVVYHSHLLEHIDRDDAPKFIAECFRVLKPGGVIRIVVPDLEQLAQRYVKLLGGGNPTAHPDYDRTLDEIFDQMVPRVPRERANRPAVVRLVENIFVGDTARNGSLHRWMYDRFSIERLLKNAGFVDCATFDHRSSRIAGWDSFGLDVEPDGSPYKPGSIYVEAMRPR
jgi:SAM-dependent methyltransferase